MKAKIIQVTLKTVRFLGPVAGAIKGELSKQETVRALTKAVVVGAATKASMFATIQQADVLTDVVVPLAAAAFTGILDALSRLQQGDPKPLPVVEAPPQVPLPEVPKP
jgi:hypothetical protein